MSLSRFVQVLAEEPARIFGIHPRKGVLQIGSDADVAVYDPGPEGVIEASRLATNSDFTPFEGMRAKGSSGMIFTPAAGRRPAAG